MLISFFFLFSIFRLGEPFPFRGRQTLCKYYDNNQILNEQLLHIKSAQTVREFEKLFNDHLRHNRNFAKSAKSYIEPYYDTKAVLHQSKPFVSETCLCTRDPYRLNINRLANEQQRTPSPAVSTSNTIKSLNGRSTLDEFVHIASECYDKCINIYLDNLNDCNRRAEIIERQSIKPSTGYAARRSLKAKKISEYSLANQINKLCINLDTHHCDVVEVSRKPEPNCIDRQSHSSTPICSHQTMSCNDTNNNSTDSTNQLKDPPKIVLSDHSTNQTIQGDKVKEFRSDSTGSADKNCLAIPIENCYSGEARPP